MNKFLFAFFFLFYTVCSYSQIADTKMGMSKEVVQKMLQNRFGYTDNTDETSITYWDVSYAGYKWDYINFDFKIDKQDQSHLSEIELSRDFVYLESAKEFLYKLKEKLSYDFAIEKTRANVPLSYESHNNDSEVNLYIYINKNSKKKYSVWLCYEDEKPLYVEQDLNESILYTNFGDSYDKTKRILEHKLGNCSESSRDWITYDDVWFANIKWDSSYFYFIYTSTTSHLSAILLRKSCFDADEAKRFRDNICKYKFCNHTFNKYKIEENGFKTRYSDESESLVIVSIKKDYADAPFSVIVIVRSKLYNSEDKF